MKKKKLQKAINAYSKTGDVYALCRMLRDLLLYVAEYAEGGHEIEFLKMLPFIVKRLKDLDLDLEDGDNGISKMRKHSKEKYDNKILSIKVFAGCLK